jgi:hypothetical protein
VRDDRRFRTSYDVAATIDPPTDDDNVDGIPSGSTERSDHGA